MSTVASQPTSNPSYDESRRVAEAGRETEWRLPSFGKELFLGHLQMDLISPQPGLDPELAREGADLVERVRSFLTAEVDPGQIERDARIPEHVLNRVKEMGLLGIKLPKAYGGLGLDQYHYNKVLGVLGTYNSALAVLISAHQSIGVAEPLRLFGTDAQKNEWLPKVATDHISAFLLTEPDVGSDPARVSTMAVPTEDGSGYLLNGEKLWATNGSVADVLVVMAKVAASEGTKGGITAFICPAHAPGVSVVTRNTFVGLRGLENSLTRFENVFLPNDAVIGKVGQGLKIALTTLNTGRLSVPALCLASSKYALKIARQFAVERRQWGASIGKHDAVAQKLAYIAGTTFGLEAVVDVSSRLADDHRNDIRIEAALAKLYCSEMSWRVVDEMIQIRGGRAYETADSLAARGEVPVPAEQLLRDIRINRIFEGSTEIMHLLIAREAVDQHLKVAGDLLVAKDAAEYARAGVKAGGFYVKWFPQLAAGTGQNPTAYSEFGPLATHARSIERAARKLARSTFYLMARYQGRLENKGALLARVVDIGAELYAMSCAIVYAQTVGRERPVNGEGAIELADLFCTQARRRVDLLFHELWANDDDEQYAAAQRLLEGRHLWFEADILDPSDPNGERPPATTNPSSGK